MFISVAVQYVPVIDCLRYEPSGSKSSVKCLPRFKHIVCPLIHLLYILVNTILLCKHYRVRSFSATKVCQRHSGHLSDSNPELSFLLTSQPSGTTAYSFALVAWTTIPCMSSTTAWPRAGGRGKEGNKPVRMELKPQRDLGQTGLNANRVCHLNLPAVLRTPSH